MRKVKTLFKLKDKSKYRPSVVYRGVCKKTQINMESTLDVFKGYNQERERDTRSVIFIFHKASMHKFGSLKRVMTVRQFLKMK